eukprot:scaffold4440_cov109-Isochrysis_galbana.AAC.1
MSASLSTSLRADYGGALNRCVAIIGRAYQHTEWVRKSGIIANAAAMHHDRRRREAELVSLEEVVRAYAKAARMLV